MVGLDRAHDLRGHVLGLEDLARCGDDVHALRVRVKPGVEQVRVDAHGAEAVDLDTPVAVGHREPLRQRDGGRLADRVGRVADLREHAGGRRRRHPETLAALEPRGNEQARCRHVRVDVHAHRRAPGVLVAETRTGADPGIGEEAVDAPGRVERALEERCVGDVPGDRARPVADAWPRPG